MSTSRDFRIQGDVLKEALAAQEVSSDSVSDSEVSLIVLGHCVNETTWQDYLKLIR